MKRIRLLFAFSLSLVFSSCVFLLDTSPKGLHEFYITQVLPTYVGKKAPTGALKTTVKQNGNYENMYKERVGVPKAQTCHYFLEYDPLLKIVVAYRIEESHQYACRMTLV